MSLTGVRGKEKNDDSAYYYHQLPAGIRDDFSVEQAREIQKVITRAIRVPSKKIVSLEFTFWFFKRFYMVFYLGEDRRTLARFADQNSVKILKLLSHSVMTLLIWCTTIFVALSILYYTKTILGFDVFPDQHAEEVIMESLRNKVE